MGQESGAQVFGRVARLEGVCVHGPFQVETFIILRDQGKFSFESLSIQSKASEIKLISHANIRPALGPLFSGGWRQILVGVQIEYLRQLSGEGQ